MNAPLDKLHDFYQPVPPSWIPQTAGWYIVFAVAGIALIWIAVREFRRWNRNRYRREALRELSNVSIEQISALLKRTALAAWPREHVASLSGNAWLAFLNKTAAEAKFQQSPGNRIEDLALQTATLSAEEERQLRHLAETWIRRHRVQA